MMAFPQFDSALEFAKNRRRLVGRGAVDDNHLEVGIVELAKGAKRAAQAGRPIVRVDDDADGGLHMAYRSLPASSLRGTGTASVIA